MKARYLLAFGLPAGLAFPTALTALLSNPEVRELAFDLPVRDLSKRDGNTSLTLAISRAEKNCGPIACKTFDAREQYVSTTGAHAFQSPSATDIRGPCPGLNAAANHGYLNRNGVMDRASLVSGLSAAYGMGEELVSVLHVIATIIAGDIATQTWSIGGPQPFSSSPLGTPPQGLSYSHNFFEADTSLARDDAYLHFGDGHSANVSRFAEAIAIGRDNNRYTLDKFRQLVANNQDFSIRNNPYYFSPLTSATTITPMMYSFAINFMSNHSTTSPAGYLDEYNFKAFFGMQGTYPNYNWLPGQETIPSNFYRRPSTSQYNTAEFASDLAINWGAYPNSFKIGGNTNGVNSYQGVNVSTLTNGTYTNQNLLNPSNAACLYLQAQRAVISDETKGSVNDATASLTLYDSVVQPILTRLKCKPLTTYDKSQYNAYPGRIYNPHGPAQNFKL